MTHNFNPHWNPHYDFNNPLLMAEIAMVDGYDITSDKAEYAPGQTVDSPWGSNRVLEVSATGGHEMCTKEIIVRPGYMLSLQRHRGRKEKWAVQSGVLTAILDGACYDVAAGQSIDIPQGAVHCMINASNESVTVIETQEGICRERDNIRLVDSSMRATYPLTSEAEFRSAILYAKMQSDLFHRFGTGGPALDALLQSDGA